MTTLLIIKAIYFVIFCALVYGFVMFIRIANRAIKALDIFIREHSDPQSPKNTDE